MNAPVTGVFCNILSCCELGRSVRSWCGPVQGNWADRRRRWKVRRSNLVRFRITSFGHKVTNNVMINTINLSLTIWLSVASLSFVINISPSASGHEIHIRLAFTEIWKVKKCMFKHFEVVLAY